MATAEPTRQSERLGRAICFRLGKGVHSLRRRNAKGRLGSFCPVALCPLSECFCHNRPALPAQVSRTRGNLSNDRHGRGAGQRATCTLSFKKQLGSSGRRMLHSWQLSSRGGELEIMTSPQFDAHGFDRKTYAPFHLADARGRPFHLEGPPPFHLSFNDWGWLFSTYAAYLSDQAWMGTI